MNAFVGTAALAGSALGTVALSIDPASAASEKEGFAISQELWDLGQALRDADKALKAAHDVYNAEYIQYRAWGKRNPEPKYASDRRAWRRWDGKFKAYMRSCSFHATQGAHEEACEAHAALRKAIAEYRARDMNEVVYKACLVCVFEDRAHNGGTYFRPYMAQGVAFDLARIGTSGSAPLNG
ncbi:hypothetical protein [Bradyrhizobium sp. USDA 3256]